MKTFSSFSGALALCALLTPAAFATTMTNLSSFGGIEEPQQIYHPATDSFTTDSFQNITDVTSGTVQMLLRYSTSAWDGDRTTGNTDRGRAEVKTLGANQKIHETFDYTTTWKTNSGFQGSGSFCHITQLKPIDGTEGSSGAPLVVTSIERGTSAAVVRYASTSFSPTNVFNTQDARAFSWTPGTFLALKIRIKTTADGGNDGQVLASINGDSLQGVSNVEVSRPAAQTYYPKWGLYRKTTTTSPFTANDFIQHSNVSATKVTSTNPAVSDPIFTPAAGTYSSAQSVTITSATSGATIHYTTDGSTPTSSSGTVYSGPITVASNTTIKAIASLSGSPDSAVVTAVYVISLPQAAAPVFSPAGGSFTTAQNVTITTSSSGASIRYTTDGSTPTSTTGTVYSGPVTISSTQTLKAIAYGSGFTPSPVTSATYTITPPPTVTMEAESLTRTASGATASTANDTNASGGVWLALNADGVGDFLDLTTTALQVGTYQIKFKYKSNTSRGQLSLKVDGAQIGGTIDEYATTQTYPEVVVGNVTFATAGTHTIRLTVTGKNASSSAYTIVADRFVFTGQ